MNQNETRCGCPMLDVAPGYWGVDDIHEGEQPHDTGRRKDRQTQIIARLIHILNNSTLLFSYRYMRNVQHDRMVTSPFSCERRVASLST